MKGQNKAALEAARLLSELVDQVSRLRNKRDLVEFLRALLTPQELIELPKRLQIVKLLKQGLPQREVARRVGVGIATVTRGARELGLGNFKHV